MNWYEIWSGYWTYVEVHAITVSLYLLVCFLYFGSVLQLILFGEMVTTWLKSERIQLSLDKKEASPISLIE